MEGDEGVLGTIAACADGFAIHFIISLVVPAKAGTQGCSAPSLALGARFRGHGDVLFHI